MYKRQILRKRAEEILELVHMTQREIAYSDEVIVGDVYIGAGESDLIRIFAKAACCLQKQYPGIHYHIRSGNAVFVKEYLDRGLIDFGVIYGPVDTAGSVSYTHLRQLASGCRLQPAFAANQQQPPFVFLAGMPPHRVYGLWPEGGISQKPMAGSGL